MSAMAEPVSKGHKFGAFKGVFTPSILTILGVVMYLRMGWVLGNVGLPSTLAIITISSGITFLTALSLAALATNMRVGAGGAYFIISRSLGVEAGAAIGLPLYVAQALSISFYIAGFAESLVQVFPVLHPTLVGVVTLILLTTLVYVSADMALKSQFVIMGAIALSLVSFFMGTGEPQPPAPTHGVLETLSFWPVFAVFFPAVTGIEAGVAMSGDLKNPERSLPYGTIAAVVFGYLVYLAIPIVLALRGVDQAVLLDDPLVMVNTARVKGAVMVGIWAASLSSGLGSLLGAPRTLQALARDVVVPRWIGRGYGDFNDPRFATIISFGIGLSGILLGDLNAIAPVLAMFFLTSYGVLNLSAGIEELVSNPAWRPTFRIRAGVPLSGFAACLIVMLMLGAGATIVAAMTCMFIYYVMKRRSMRARWGDMRLAFMAFITRVMLYRMAGLKLDERTWKPNLLVLSGIPSARWYLIQLADAIAQSRSFVTVAAFIPDENWTTERLDAINASIRSYLKKNRVPAFVRTLPAADPFAGAETMIRSYGFGPIYPNTIMIGETEQKTNFIKFAALIQLIARSQRNLVIVRENIELEEQELGANYGVGQTIDLWWPENTPHTAFMLAVAILLKRSPDWQSAVLKLHTIVDSEDEVEDAVTLQKAFLRDARIDAEVSVIVRGDERHFDVIKRVSVASDLVLLGMRPPGEDESAEDYSVYYEDMMVNTEQLPATALLMSGEKVDFHRMFESS